jgi:hypothetical protein
MKYFGRFMLLTVGLAFVAFVLSSLPSHPTAAAGGPAVTVVNTSANPVPVTGSVNSTVSGAVSITGTPSVQITNAPAVNVTNTPTTAIPTVVAPAASTIYNQMCTQSTSDTNIASCTFAGFAPGTLVITSASVASQNTAGEDPLNAQIQSGGGSPVLFIPMTKQTTVNLSSGNADFLAGASSGVVMLPGSSSPPICLLNTHIASAGEVIVITCTISGYVVPAD